MSESVSESESVPVTVTGSKKEGSSHGPHSASDCAWLMLHQQPPFAVTNLALIVVENAATPCFHSKSYIFILP